MVQKAETVGGGGALSAGSEVTIQPPSGESWTIEQLLLTYSGGNNSDPLGDRQGIRYITPSGDASGWIWGTNNGNNDPRDVAVVGGGVEGDGGKQWSIRPLPIDNDVYVAIKNTDCTNRSYIYSGTRHK